MPKWTTIGWGCPFASETFNFVRRGPKIRVGWFLHPGGGVGGGKLTSSTFPFPLSLIAIAKDVSRLLAGSLTLRKAWCGCFGLRSSLVVIRTFSVSDEPSMMGFESDFFGANL